MTEEGKKFDTGKRSPIAEGAPECCVISADAAEYLLGPKLAQLSYAADVISFGALKYGPGNWRYVESGRRRYSDAYWRHALANVYYPESPIIDPESGFTHEAHAICNLIFLSWEGLK